MLSTPQALETLSSLFHRGGRPDRDLDEGRRLPALLQPAADPRAADQRPHPDRSGASQEKINNCDSILGATLTCDGAHVLTLSTVWRPLAPSIKEEKGGRHQFFF